MQLNERMNQRYQMMTITIDQVKGQKLGSILMLM